MTSAYSSTVDSGKVGENSADEEDREIARIDLLEARRRRHLDRQPPLRHRERGLHVERSAVDIAVEIELDGDLR